MNPRETRIRLGDRSSLVDEYRSSSDLDRLVELIEVEHVHRGQQTVFVETDHLQDHHDAAGAMVRRLGQAQAIAAHREDLVIDAGDADLEQAAHGLDEGTMAVDAVPARHRTVIDADHGVGDHGRVRLEALREQDLPGSMDLTHGVRVQVVQPGADVFGVLARRRLEAGGRRRQVVRGEHLEHGETARPHVEDREQRRAERARRRGSP